MNSPRDDHAPRDAASGLLRAILDSLTGPPPDEWAAMAMVFELRDREVVGSYGYFYSPDGSITPRSADPDQAALDAYLATLYAEGAEWPVKMLVQWDRASGAYEVTFEDRDRDRWRVTPATLEAVREGLRPSFG